MAITLSGARSEIQSLFADIREAAENQIAAQDIPLLGSGLTIPAGELLFSALETQVLSALDGISGGAPDIKQAIADALDALDFVSASVVGDNIDINIDADAAISLLDESFDLGASVGGIGLDFDGTIATELKAALDIALRLEDASGALKILDNPGGAELQVGLEGTLSLNAEGSLGFLDITATDNDPTAPEIEVSIGIDLPTGDAGDIVGAPLTPVINGSAKLDLDIDIKPLDFLPNISTDFILEFPSLTAPAPIIAFNNISIDVGSYFGVFKEAIGALGEILDAEPLGTILDIVTGPLPVIDSLSDKVGLDPLLDVVPIIKDGVISLVDLAVLKDEVTGGSGTAFYEALANLGLIRSFAQQAGQGEVILGNISLSDNLADPLSTFDSLVGLTGLDEFDSAIRNNPFFASLTEELTDSFTSDSGFSMPLLEDPTLIVQLLFNDLFDPVDLVRFDLPDLELEAEAVLFFPLLGPLGLQLRGQVDALIDLTVGYDTFGFETGDLLNGFYFSTPENPGPLTGPDGNNPTGYNPVGTLDTRIDAGAALRAVILNASVTGGINFGMAGFLAVNADGKLRIEDLEGCFLQPLRGKASADVRAEIEIGFGLFSYTQVIPIASTVLADFDVFSCPPYSDEPTSPPGQGLATMAGLGVPGELVLNTGNRAAQRVINGAGGTPIVGVDEPEFYVINLARDSTPNPEPLGDPIVGAPIEGALDITAFGLTQRFGNAGDEVFVIKGDLGAGNDSLMIALDVGRNSTITGGAGDDFISGSNSDDRFEGQDDNDYLVGNGGNDYLLGGNGNDVLEGGAGADTMDGGFGRDQVTYENSAVGVQFTPDGAGGFIGTGGDAAGDVLISIEYLVGSQHNDTLIGNQSEANTIEGLAGNDALFGGSQADFILGSAGGDYMDGRGGRDATSYLTSLGPVWIDLLFGNASMGDAQGDTLISIENVQGTWQYDRLYGSNSDNTLDGWLGDDILEGRGGRDIVLGFDGNDTIYAVGDGDELDGGNGLDLLSYTNALGAVQVNLKTADAAGNDVIGYRDPFTNILTIFVDYSTFENLDGSNNFGDTLLGDLGYNRIRGLGGNDTINGDDGNDTIVGGFGADNITGGNGIDWVHYNDGFRVFVNLAAGFGQGSVATGDILAQDIENILGTTGADTLIGNDLGNVIDPGLSTFTGFDTVEGGDGFDTLKLDYSKQDYGQGMVGGMSEFDDEPGHFVRMASNGIEVLDEVYFTGVERIDVIGTYKADWIQGGDAHDFIQGGGGDDTLYAGRGSDHVIADDGDDFVSSGNNFSGDLVRSVNAADAMYLDGGRGIDTLSVSLAAETQNIAMVGTLGLFELPFYNLKLLDGTTIRNFEILRDVFTGSGHDSLMQLGSFDNQFDTGFGSDTIRSGLGIDYIDGGSDYTDGLEVSVFADDEGGFTLTLLNEAAFRTNPGDLLILDFSSVGGAEGVIGQTGLHFPSAIFNDLGNPLMSNYGFYYFASSSVNQTSFEEIERLDVTGTQQDDVIAGTQDVYLAFGTESMPGWFGDDVIRGDDTLVGLGGDDTIIGYTGDDSIDGGGGNDLIFGSDPDEVSLTVFNSADEFAPDRYEYDFFGFASDRYEIDTLTGGGGADTFILGTEAGIYYVGRGSNSLPSSSRAIITDFDDAEGDSIQLHGRESDYFTVEVDGNTLIYHNPRTDGNGGFYFFDDLIAEIRNFTGFNLEDLNYVTYVTPGSGLRTSSEPPAPDLPMAAAAAAAEDEPEAESFAALAATGWVTQTNDTNDLLASLFGASTNLTTVSLELDGDGRAFGTFDGDPFGLGTGIILSTGLVEDVDEPNTEDGGTSPTFDVPLTFVKIGRVGATDIFRADLSNLSIEEIASITLRDSNSKMFGASGAPSGFDLDSIMLSRTLLNSVDDTVDINSNTVLPKLDVFDFSDAGIDFLPGTQRGFAEPDLSGVINDVIILDAQHLGIRDAVGAGPVGNTSLGDGGQITFNLTQAVSTNQPLYLYVGEDGAVGETLDGSISVSDQRTDAPTDLSTDFGHVGAEDDTISMTYTFTANSTDVDTLLFDFMFFSEELVEFAGSEFNDTFKIMLNGVNMALLSDGAAASVNALKAAPFAPNHPDLILNPDGTGPTADSMRADAYTKLLTFAGALQDGVNTLTIEVADVRDGLLDSGIMVKGGTMRAGFSGGGFGAGAAGPDATTPQVTEGGPSIFIPITINPGGSGVLTEAVTVTFTAGPDLDLGNGPGVPLQVTFNPGSSLTYSLEVKAPNDGLIEGSEFGVIDVTLTSADPAFNNLAVAPIVVEILDAPPAGVGLSVAFGTATAPNQWYLTSATAGISPIDIAPLPGPKPAVNTALNMLTAGSSGPWNNALLFDGRILANTNGGIDTFDVVGLWNSVANFQAKSVEAEKMVFDGFTHVDASVGTSSTEDSELTLEGVMRANLVTGAGDDKIDIAFVGNQNAADFSDDFRIFTDGGDDLIVIRSFDFQSAFAGGDQTYLQGSTASEVLNNDLGPTRSYIETGDGDDTVLAGGGADDIGGGEGNDYIYGGHGNDTIRGGGGDDRLRGGPGDDQVFGGRGNDDLGAAEGNDFIYGDHGNDILRGNEGNDRLRGGPGDDFVMGDEGDDDIGGAEGNDSLLGGNGNDTIHGGNTGDDTLTGGGGSDLFQFNALLGIGTDRITDFEVGVDLIELQRFTGVGIGGLKDLIHQDGNRVVIDLTSVTGHTDIIIIENTNREALLAADSFLI